MTPTHEQWAEKARYDLDTASAMLDSGRYVYVLFCCQQAIEKMLKAIIVKRTGEMPPRIHNLMRLADRATVSIDEDQAGLFRNLSNLYVDTRYPEEDAAISAEIDEPRARAALEETEEVVQWLSSML